MALETSDLKRRLNSGPADEQLLVDALESANVLVDEYIAEQGTGVEVPEKIHDRAVLRCAVELFNQDKAPNGIVNQQYDAGNGETGSTPVRIGRDPMVGARALLDEAWTLPVSIG